MGKTRFRHPIQAPNFIGAGGHWLSNDAEAWYVGSVNASDNNDGRDYDRPLARISKATVDKVPTSAGAANGRGDIVHVSVGNYAENVRVEDRDYVRIIGAGRGLCTVKPSDTASSQNTDALGQSQTIALPSEGTQQTNWAFIIGSRGVVLTGFTVLVSSGTAAATGGVYIGDGGRYDSSAAYGASKFHIYDMDFDGQSTVMGGWAFAWDGIGGGGIIEDCNIFGFRSGGLLVNSGITKATEGCIFRWNIIHGCRGYGIRRTPGMSGGDNLYLRNLITEDSGNTLTNGILLGANVTRGDKAAGNWLCTAATTPISGTASDRLSGNFLDSPGGTATYVSES